MDYQKLADQVITHVGGQKNIQNLTHCATRLRFNLTDDIKAKSVTTIITPFISHP